jgi:ABC-type multidrug transport system ATPase subunit
VGRHLFDQCIRGVLNKKTVLLVTHQLQYAKQRDKLIVLEAGSIVANGSYDNVVNSNASFAATISQVNDNQLDDQINDELDTIPSEINDLEEVVNVQTVPLEPMKKMKHSQMKKLHKVMFRSHFTFDTFALVQVIVLLQ